MHMHPETHIQMVDQDRERALTLRALQRAARDGGSQQPGLARGGIAGFAALLRSVATALGGRSQETDASGPSLPGPSIPYGV